MFGKLAILVCRFALKCGQCEVAELIIASLCNNIRVHRLSVRYPQHSSRWHPVILATEAGVGVRQTQVERMAGFVAPD
jgi:hypothetical protein